MGELREMIQKFFWIWILFCPASFSAPFLVVIDPGHGGEDHGTAFRQSERTLYEKNITLQLAQRAAQELTARGVQTVLTRREDRNVPLSERTAMANRLKANVFVSFHLNSSHTGETHAQAEGIETYILNNSSDASSRRLANLENAVLEGSVANDTSQQGSVGLIVKDLILDSNVVGSKHLACIVQSRLLQKTSRSSTWQQKNRGVKQALFYVLLGADMPSILVEAGFLSHARDRALVSSDWGQRLFAKGFAEAIEQYRVEQRIPKSRLNLSNCKVN